MNTERPAGKGRSVSPLTRADVELLRSKVESSASLDLSFQNLQHIDLSYMDLQGANLRGADLQGANLRGTNLSETDLQGAHLNDADLNGADLSRAHLGDNEANRADLHHAKLSYATLSGLDLRNADLNGTDLRNALLHGTDLRGAELSTAQLYGPELRGAKLFSDELFGHSLKQTHRGSARQKKLTPGKPMLTQERSSPMQEQGVKQIKQTLTDREAYILGEHALLGGADPVKIRRLFPQGFNFVIARQLFDAWLLQSVDTYSEKEINAMWIGFAHRVCDLYHQDEPEA